MASSDPVTRSEIFEKPMCLVSSEKDGQFYINEPVLNLLKNIKDDLVVVAVVGLYRTGKSFLMNRLFGRMDGFPLGNTIEAKTKGIWIWCREHPHKTNTVLVLVDTEGLGDPKKGNIGHDNEICTLATLLCNVLVYNMMTAFNQDVVEKLTFISEMSRKVLFRNTSFRTEREDQLHLITPVFVLSVRDFSLNLRSGDEEITEDQYLEDCLKLKPEVDENSKRFNRARRCIRKYFIKRKCFTFDRPGGKSVMKNMEKARIEDLSEDFLQDTDKFCEYVYSCRPKVLLNSKHINGAMLATLVSKYVSAIQNGAIPDVDDAFATAANLENERMGKEAIEEFKKLIDSIEMPILKVQAFEDLYQKIKNNSLKDFRRQSVFNAEIYEKRVVNEMDILWKDVKYTNLVFVSEVCKAKLIEMYDETVGNNLKEHKYHVIRGFQLYQTDMENLQTDYRAIMRDVDQNVVMQTLFDFKEQEQENKNIVLKADLALSEEEKKRERERTKRDFENLRNDLDKNFEKMQKELNEKAANLEAELIAERQKYERERQNDSNRITRMKNSLRETNEKQNELMDELSEMAKQNKILEQKYQELDEQRLQKQNEVAEKDMESERRQKQTAEEQARVNKDVERDIENRNDHTREQKRGLLYRAIAYVGNGIKKGIMGGINWVKKKFFS